jgi:predicted acylesterase/phospholipase RssA
MRPHASLYVVATFVWQYAGSVRSVPQSVGFARKFAGFSVVHVIDVGRRNVRAEVITATRNPSYLFAVIACALSLAGCATAARVAFTEQEQATASIPGIPNARFWADDVTAIGTARRSMAAGAALKQPTVLALSGGGANGAFGAGLLSGWSASGTRPQFTFVTGASAGALIAPFAFLGASHDETLKSVFASGEMANLLQSDTLAGLFGTGFFKAAPLRELIARHVDAELLAEIATEYQKGRRLYVVTTNLDAQRTAIWDMGKIAASGGPEALDLFRNVLTASASIPGVFSPMFIDVEADGRHFAEMHVDGGVTTNILIVPEALLLSGTPLFAPDARPKVYIVMNGKLAPEFEVVGETTLKIVSRSIASAVRANTRNTLFASYQFAKRRNWEFNLASIDAQYPTTKSIGFDTAYMAELFQYGYQRGVGAQRWRSTPLE